MWLTFLAACVIAVLILYIPGLLVLGSMRSFTWSDRLAGAPLVCVAFYGSVSLVYPVLGIRASLVSLVAPLVLIGLATLVIHAVFGGRGGEKASPRSGAVAAARELAVPAVYVLMGVVLTTMVFVKNLDGAASFFQAYDNGSHLNTIRVFLETGNYSSFNSSAYAAAGSVAPIASAPGFYPAAWHLVVALVISSTGAPITLGVNAVNAVLLGVVFPLSMCGLLSRLFGKGARPVLFGAVICLAFSTSVWDFVNFGPLYPMLMSYVLVPAVTACFITLFDRRLNALGRAAHVAVFLIGCVSVALAQPSGIFLMAVILAPFCVWQAHVIAARVFRSSKVGPIASAAAMILFVCIVWMFCYQSPFFEGTVDFNWPSHTSLRQAVVDVVLLSMHGRGVQLLLACFVVIGIVLACKDRKRRWLVASYLIAAITYVVCVTTEGDLKHILGGFWYTDPHRLAANVAIVAAPFAALGADFIVRLSTLVFDRVHARFGDCPSGQVVSGLLALLFCAVIFYPSFMLRGVGEIETSFGGLEESIKQQNDTQAVHVLDADEAVFAEEALSMVPEGSLIINYSNDGSGFLYALYGANIYYRNFALSTAGKGETDESYIIRHSLSEIASNNEVRSAVDAIGARYVLLLDQGEKTEKPRDYFWSNYPEQWEGIGSIRDDTPGFTVLLSRGDMRLYRIDA